jgi:hypothetical protein
LNPLVAIATFCDIAAANWPGAPREGLKQDLINSTLTKIPGLTGLGLPLGFEHWKQKQNTHEKPRGCSAFAVDEV